MRLRIIGYLVQPQLMADDGENLTPLPVQPLTILAADWPGVVALVADGVEALRQQVEGPAQVAPQDEPKP